MIYKIKTSMVVEAFRLRKPNEFKDDEFDNGWDKHVDELHDWLDKHLKFGIEWEGFDGGIYLNNDYHDSMSEEGMACHQGDYLVAWAPGYVLPLKAEVFENLVEPE
jgi:hypothetical protein